MDHRNDVKMFKTQVLAPVSSPAPPVGDYEIWSKGQQRSQCNWLEHDLAMANSLNKKSSFKTTDLF